jgi:hypothetical protein
MINLVAMSLVWETSLSLYVPDLLWQSNLVLLIVALFDNYVLMPVQASAALI